MSQLTVTTVPAAMFFRLEETYAACAKYAITHLCDWQTAQIAVVGKIIFD